MRLSGGRFRKHSFLMRFIVNLAISHKYSIDHLYILQFSFPDMSIILRAISEIMYLFLFLLNIVINCTYYYHLAGDSFITFIIMYVSFDLWSGVSYIIWVPPGGLKNRTVSVLHYVSRRINFRSARRRKES